LAVASITVNKKIAPTINKIDFVLDNNVCA
jgi:hypothetical protein